ncbi:MAG: hypothetical protein JWQ09_2332 [Segetibacter sp.]|nr:hypothetical protein [Segetibacter sp.]
MYMKVQIGLLFCLVITTFSSLAQINLEASLGVLKSVDTYNSYLVTSQLQPWIGVEEASQKPFTHLGIRGRFTLSASLYHRLRALVQTGANLRFAENLWGYKHTYATLPLQGGLAYTLIKNKSYALSVQAYSGLNIFSISNPLAQQQTGSLHNAELCYWFRSRSQSKSFIVKTGFELETDHETFFYHADQSYLHDENFSYKVRRNQVYLSVGWLF